MKRIVLAITGASGAIYGIRLLECLQKTRDTEVHLILSEAAELTISLETPYSAEQVKSLASYCWDNHCIHAPIASGSFPVAATVIIPCSMKTLAGIASGYAEALILRAADTAIKEGRPLVLCPRETPLSAIHLENMLKLARLGVGILPPMPALYGGAQTVEDLVAHHVMKVMDYLRLPYEGGNRWQGMRRD